MRLIVGLGNPGATYSLTRHNLGFRVVTRLAQGLRIPLRRSLRLKARLGRGRMGTEEVLLLLPMAYMNRSGRAVARCLQTERLPLSQMLVVLDDLQLSLGRLRIRGEGSEGGHQGLYSVIEAVESQRFPRLRLGIGAPKDQSAWEEYVLERFRSDERPTVEGMIEKAVTCCRLWISEGTQSCANHFNIRA